MNSLVRSLLAAYLLMLMSAALAPVSVLAFVAPNDAINAVLGDVSFVRTFGTAPDKHTNETLRIRTHLRYVGDLIRARDVKHLPAALQRKRSYLLEKLDEYRTAGRFPKNVAYITRRPCFIDADGAICAVGYLIEQSAGRALAERINAVHQYDYISTMTMPELHAWVRSSGLTLEECAMIQPGYPGQPAYDLGLQILTIQPTSTVATLRPFDIKLYIRNWPTTNAFIVVGRSRDDNMLWLSIKDITSASITITSGTTEYQYQCAEITTTIPASTTAATYLIHIRNRFATSLRDPSYFYGGFFPYTIFASTATSIVRFTQDNDSEIFPNPAHETFTFQNGTEQVWVRLVTALGEEVHSENIVAARERYTFDLRGLASGVYFLETRSNAGRRVQKLIKY